MSTPRRRRRRRRTRRTRRRRRRKVGSHEGGSRDHPDSATGDAIKLLSISPFSYLSGCFMRQRRLRRDPYRLSIIVLYASRQPLADRAYLSGDADCYSG
ncbi:unnamed protein product [Pleuronectes platessa]|uniref:Uncharacterized protein n=1 Tax=Pleuronectes platessa TaxID=8262 RepID=A0A9N7VHW5_PLEPL|nr:unnamed protein product [Pleuronectes platessa]